MYFAALENAVGIRGRFLLVEDQNENQQKCQDYKKILWLSCFYIYLSVYVCACVCLDNFT